VINSIIEAISISLNAEFGDNYKIYAEKLKQGFQEPCFFISCINPTNELFLNRRYFRTNQFVIQYFPADNTGEKTECNEVAERLYLCLEWITFNNDLTMGTKMRCETVDGILNFFVNYDMFMYKVKDSIPMENLTLEQLEKEVK
jgi:hypothetical protein